MLKARVRTIKDVDLYDHIQATKVCLVLNVVVPKKFCIPEFIKYIATHCPATHLKSYYNKRA
jgi:hypothetical protein